MFVYTIVISAKEDGSKIGEGRFIYLYICQLLTRLNKKCCIDFYETEIWDANLMQVRSAWSVGICVSSSTDKSLLWLKH